MDGLQLVWLRNVRKGLIAVLEVFDLPAPYRPFNPVFMGQLSGNDFTNSSTRHEPDAVIRHFDLIVGKRLIAGAYDR